MKKIIFLQVPEEFNFTLRLSAGNHFNTPVFCGYHYCLLNQNKFRNLEGEIFETGLTDIAGDDLIFKRLVARKPDILWMPLLSEGNYQRSVYLAEKIKEVYPHLKVIAAGPEIPFTLGKFFPENIDVGIFSQRIETLVELFNALNEKNPGFFKIKGIIYRKSNALFINNLLNNFPSIRTLPSPYLSGALDFALRFPRIWIETRRGCPNSCLYCYHGRLDGNKEAYFSLGRIKKELEYFKSKGVKRIAIMDPTFNHPSFWVKKICQLIYSINKDGEIEFEGNLRADYVDKEQADLFQRCNFKLFTTGVQTIAQRILKEITRKNNFKSWIKGVNLLAKRHITIDSDIIIGLPGDNLNSFKQTVDFLVSNGMQAFTKSFILFVPPISRLWDKINTSEIKFQQYPPHLLLDSPTFSFDDIKEGINYARECSMEIIPKPFRGEEYNHSQLVSGVSPSYPSSGFLWELEKALRDEDLPVTRLIIDLDCGISFKKLCCLVEIWRSQLASTAVVWFKGEDLSKKVKLVRIMLRLLSLPNPYTIWNIVLESGKIIKRSLLENLEGEVVYRPHNLDYQGIYLADSPKIGYYRCATRFYLIYPLGQKRNPAIKESIKYHFYCSLKLDRVEGIEKKLKGLMAEDCEGCLLDFDSSFNSTKILQIMSFIKANNWKKKIILFKDWYLQCLWDLKFDGKYEIEGEEEKIIYLDSGGGIKFKKLDKKLLTLG